MARKPTLTLREAHKAVKWFKAQMGMEDWAFSIQITPYQPEWYETQGKQPAGACCTWRDRKEAIVWIDPRRFGQQCNEPLITLFHECAHVIAEDLELGGRDTDGWDFVCNRLGELMASAYHKGVDRRTVGA